jgi:hypothetical protein
VCLQEKDRVAQERYGKPFNELSTNEQKGVGGECWGPAEMSLHTTSSK